jgi:hypothetical protein
MKLEWILNTVFYNLPFNIKTKLMSLQQTVKTRTLKTCIEE